VTYSSYSVLNPGASTDSFFTDGENPPQIQRNFGRSFGGQAAAHNGKTDGNVTGGSWLQSFTVPALSTTAIDGWDYFEDFSRCAWVTTGGISLAGVSRSAEISDALGGVFAAMNDYTGLKKGWAAYIDAVKGAAGAGSTFTIEANIANLPGVSPRGGATPYNIRSDGQTIGLVLAAGSDAAVFGRSYAVDAAAEVIDNGAVFHTGINFRNAIMRRGMTDDKTAAPNTGYARAIGMQYDQGISWYSLSAQVVSAPATVVGTLYIIQSVGTTDFTLIGAASNTVGVSFTATGAGTGTGTCSIAGSQTEAVRIWGQVSSPTVQWRQTFTDTGIVFGDDESPANNAFVIGYLADGAAGVKITPAIAGGRPVVAAIGSATDVNLGLSGKGAGSVVIEGLDAYATNVAAAAAGLPVGALYYRTGHGLDVVI
jgi:hypothetical protein